MDPCAPLNAEVFVENDTWQMQSLSSGVGGGDVSICETHDGQPFAGSRIDCHVAHFSFAMAFFAIERAEEVSQRVKDW